MSKKLELVLSPALQSLFSFEGKTVVIIDILRATSTIVAALDSGFEWVKTVKEIDKAMSLKDKQSIVAGERNGEKIDGFDLGNSPLEVIAHPNKTKNLVLTSTNGTKCVEIAMQKQANKVLCGSLINLNALAKYLNNDSNDLVLFCSAWKDRVNLEDTYMAGKLINMLKGYEIDCDSALMAMKTCSDNPDTLKYLEKATHFQRLVAKGNKEDVHYCLTGKQLQVVPLLSEYKDGVSVFGNIFKK